MSVGRNGGADASFGGRIVVTSALLLGLDILDTPYAQGLYVET